MPTFSRVSGNSGDVPSNVLAKGCHGIFSILFRALNCPLLAQSGVAASVEDALVLVEDELDNLVLEDHEHGDVGRLRLRPEQRGAEDDGHVLHGHTVVVAVVNHPVREREERVTPSTNRCRTNRGWAQTAAVTCVNGQKGASWCRGSEEEVTSPARRCTTAWCCSQDFLERRRGSVRLHI